MTFSYNSVVSIDSESGDYLIFRRPEIPVTVIGPSGLASYIGLVDTGSDNTIFPKSVADYLGIATIIKSGPQAIVFGGQRIQMFEGRATLKIESDGESLRWNVPISFFDFAAPDAEVVILGHAGFLDFFTATFDGNRCELQLVANEDFPTST